MKKKILISIFTIFLLTNNCGFKIINKNEIYNFDINKIITSGDNRINYKIKSKLLFNSKKSERKLIDIYLDTNKSKDVKEKNINNEITKYQITVTSTVKVKELINDNKISFTVSKIGDYTVANQYSQTLANEKKLINILTDEITDDIIDEIVLKLDDL